MDKISGSGLVQVQTQKLPQTAPEPHCTPKRFRVWPEYLNWTQFRFGVQKISPPNQTTLDPGIPTLCLGIIPSLFLLYYKLAGG